MHFKPVLQRITRLFYYEMSLFHYEMRLFHYIGKKEATTTTVFIAILVTMIEGDLRNFIIVEIKCNAVM